jgi:hypothetical protein
LDSSSQTGMRSATVSLTISTTHGADCGEEELF